jgi:hypothetical protein
MRRSGGGCEPASGSIDDIDGMAISGVIDMRRVSGLGCPEAVPPPAAELGGDDMPAAAAAAEAAVVPTANEARRCRVSGDHTGCPGKAVGVVDGVRCNESKLDSIGRSAEAADDDEGDDDAKLDAEADSMPAESGSFAPLLLRFRTNLSTRGALGWGGGGSGGIHSI